MLPSPDAQIAVTGAAGYVGGRVAAALGDAARAIVRSPVPWLPRHQQVECDLLGPTASITAALAGASAVVHLAGLNEVIAGTDPDRAVHETVAMAEAVRAATRAAGVRRVVYVSSVHVYGAHMAPGALLHEDLEPAPTSPYARARHLCEELIAADPALDAVLLRLTNAVGPPADPTIDRWTLVASDLCRSAVLDRTMVLRSTGQQWRDFIALEDACRILLGTLSDDVPPDTYNLASGRPSTVRSLAELIQDRVELACGWRPALEGPVPTGDPDEPYTVATERLAGLGLQAELALEDAVDELVDHCVKHEAALRSSAGSAR